MFSEMKINIIFILFTLFGSLLAQIPEKPQSRVNDFSGVLNPALRDKLEYRLSDLEARTSNQFFIVLLNRLPEGEQLDDFTTRLYEKWRPGLADKDNGLMILVALQERKIRIEVGYGLEDVITDAQAGAVIRDNIAPFFKKRDYYGGLNAALNVLIPAAEGKYKIPLKKKKTKGKDSSFSGLIVLLIFVFIIIRFFRGGPKNYGSRRSGVMVWPIFFGGGGSSGGFSSAGFGGGGGGFSGGFGGLSGGGGASGGW